MADERIVYISDLLSIRVACDRGEPSPEHVCWWQAMDAAVAAASFSRCQCTSQLGSNLSQHGEGCVVNVFLMLSMHCGDVCGRELMHGCAGPASGVGVQRREGLAKAAPVQWCTLIGAAYVRYQQLLCAFEVHNMVGSQCGMWFALLCVGSWNGSIRWHITPPCQSW